MGQDVLSTDPVKNALTLSGNLLATGEMYWELCFLAQFVARLKRLYTASYSYSV